MSVRIALCVCASAAVGLTASQVATASAPSSTTYSIHGRVPTICRADLVGTSQTSTDGVVDVGDIVELCNNAEGYTVKVTYSPVLGGKTLIVDAHDVTLSPDGETVVYESGTPNMREHHLALRTSDTSTAGYNIGVHITPHGQVF